MNSTSKKCPNSRPFKGQYWCFGGSKRKISKRIFSTALPRQFVSTYCWSNKFIHSTIKRRKSRWHRSTMVEWGWHIKRHISLYHHGHPKAVTGKNRNRYFTRLAWRKWCLVIILKLYWSIFIWTIILQCLREVMQITTSSTKYYKVQPIIDKLLETFSTVFYPDQEWSIDEAIKYKDRLGFVQYIPAKPVKRGVKVFCLSDSKTGYLVSFKVYTGKEDAAEEKLTDRSLIWFGITMVWTISCTWITGSTV